MMVVKYMEFILCGVEESFCSPTHNIVPHISWHDLPCHKTMKRYSDFPNMVIFQPLPGKSWIETWLCNCQQISRSSQTNFFVQYLPHRINILFLSSQFYVITHTRIRIILFHGVRISVPKWKLSPNRTSKGVSQIAFPITVLPKG